MGVPKDYAVLGALFALGGLIAVISLVLPLLLSPRYRGSKTAETYECGIETIGSAWGRFSIAFYLFALIFVAFEVDILYLFPVALVFNEAGLGVRDVVELSMFLSIPSLAIVFAWKRGVFKWT